MHASLEDTDTNGYHFGAPPPGSMFQRKIDEIFKDMPNVFGIAGDKLVAGYEADGRDHDKQHTEGTTEVQAGQLKVK